MNVITKTVQLPDGRTITIETGKVAKQADGSAVLRMGNTVLLATVCAAKEAVPGTEAHPTTTKSSRRASWTAPCVHSSPQITIAKFMYR